MVTREDSQSASVGQRLKELALSSRRRLSRSALTWKPYKRAICSFEQNPSGIPVCQDTIIESQQN
jgi:hypothetical protein